MATEPKAPAVEEVHILWISEGMSCDGDSVSITAADQPAIEDVLLFKPGHQTRFHHVLHVFTQGTALEHMTAFEANLSNAHARAFINDESNRAGGL